MIFLRNQFWTFFQFFLFYWNMSRNGKNMWTILFWLLHINLMTSHFTENFIDIIHNAFYFFFHIFLLQNFEEFRDYQLQHQEGSQPRSLTLSKFEVQVKYLLVLVVNLCNVCVTFKSKFFFCKSIEIWPTTGRSIISRRKTLNEEFFF